MMFRLSGLFRNKKKLNEQQESQPQGAVFYSILYECLRDSITTDLLPRHARRNGLDRSSADTRHEFLDLISR
jgi:hypothetical protein